MFGLEEKNLRTGYENCQLIKKNWCQCCFQWMIFCYFGKFGIMVKMIGEINLIPVHSYFNGPGRNILGNKFEHIPHRITYCYRILIIFSFCSYQPLSNWNWLTDWLPFNKHFTSHMYMLCSVLVQPVILQWKTVWKPSFEIICNSISNSYGFQT